MNAALAAPAACLLHQVFSSEELAEIESKSDTVDQKARAGLLPDACFHTSYAKGGGLKRTKFFFGARCVGQCGASLLPRLIWPGSLPDACFSISMHHLKC